MSGHREGNARAAGLALALMTVMGISAFFWTAPARSELPHTREEWMVGISLGAGPGQITDTLTEEKGEETGVVGQLRVGKMVSTRFLVHFEAHIWSHESWVGYDEIDFGLWNFAGATTFYPGDPARWTGGLWVRGGIGFSNVKVTRLSSGVTVDGTQTGWGWLLGAGYEWRFSNKFAMGLGLAFDQLVLSDGRFEDGKFVPLTVDLNWYF
jgi:hypothetical protein